MLTRISLSLRAAPSTLPESLAPDVEDEAVAGSIQLGRELQVCRSVHDHDPLRAGALEGRTRLLLREVSTPAVIELAERRLGEEEIGVARDLDDGVVRSAVGRVCERRLVVLDAQRRAPNVVVRHDPSRERE